MTDNFQLLYPPGYKRNKQTSLKNYDFIKALQLEDMVVLINQNYLGLTNISLKDYFSTDPEVLNYRLSIVEDLVENPTLYDIFCKAISTIRNIKDLFCVMSSDFSVDTSLSSIRHLEMYLEIVNLFADGFRNLELRSEGMQFFREQIMTIANSDDFRNLSSELAKTQTSFGNIKSVTLGVNLDETLSIREAGVISIEEKHFHAGTIIEKLLKKNPKDSFSLISPLYPVMRGLHGEELKAFNTSLKSALTTIYSKSIHSFEPLVQKYYNANTTFFISLLDDIRFLTAGVKFILEMREKGFSMCRPKCAPMSEKRCDLDGVYNPMLAKIAIEKTIVSNHFSFDENGRFYLVTGPNHGGKSIFAYSVGIAQALFQLGLFVPADSAVMSPVSGIFTHFPTSDENNFGKGRLESECERLGEIMKKLTDTDMLLMDESFSSTSGLEAGYIASEVLTGIGIIGCGGIYVTHIHDLPLQVQNYNAHPDNKGKIDNLVALMENKTDGTRSYKIARTTPDGLSYARDIASRYGLDLDGILANK